jgi:hypothetical protein
MKTWATTGPLLTGTTVAGLVYAPWQSTALPTPAPERVLDLQREAADAQASRVALRDATVPLGGVCSGDGEQRQSNEG